MQITSEDDTVAVANIKAWDKDMKEIASTSIRKGREFAKVVTGTTITVDLPSLSAGEKYVVKSVSGIKDLAVGDEITTSSKTIELTGVAKLDLSKTTGTSQTGGKTLTLKGLLVDDTNGSEYDVYYSTDGAKTWTKATAVANSLKTEYDASLNAVSSQQFSIPAGADVRLKGDDGSGDPIFDASVNGVYTINGVNVTLTGAASTTADQLDFKVSEDMTLWVSAKNTFNDGTATPPTKQYVLKSVGGVTGTFTYTDTTKGSKTLAANGTVLINGAGTFTVGNVGDGKYVDTTDNDSTAGNAKTAGGTFAVAGNANVTFYSGIKVTTAAGISSTGTAINAGATNFVAEGKVLTLAGGDTNDQYIVYAGNNVTTKAPQTTGKWTVSGKEDVTIDDSVKFTLGEGVKAEYTNTEKFNLDAGVWYMAKNSKKTLTLAAVDSANQAVVWPAVKSGRDMTNDVMSYYLESIQPGNNEKYEAYTIVKFTDMDDLWTYAGGVTTDIFSDAYNIANETLSAAELGGGTVTAKRVAGQLYVRPGMKFYICAKTQGTCDMSAVTVDGTSVIVPGTASRGSSTSSALAEIQIDKKLVTVTHSTITP